MTTRSIVINTLGAERKYGYQHRVTCHACQHHSVLDLDALIDRLGEHHSSMAKGLHPRLLCSRCGNRDPEKMQSTITPKGLGGWR